MSIDSIRWGDYVLDPETALLSALILSALVLVALIFAFAVSSARRRREAEAREAEAAMLRAQLASLQGGLQTVAEMAVSGQSQLARALNERLDSVTHRVGQSITESRQATTDHLGKLHERLAVIDRAQKNLTELSGNVVTLQQILNNKQARGAFGQMRMEAIIEDGLPPGAFSFQHTLSNGKRPDCMLHLPNATAGIVIDAKFPLEGFEALRLARADAEKKEASRRVRTDVGRHIDAVAERYFLPGETQETAIVFVPSESISAVLNEQFDDVLQKAYRARIFFCSPSMLMLAVQTMQAILKDVRMREEAVLIQREVGRMMEDVSRLVGRVEDLKVKFGRANETVDLILTSSAKVARRGRNIEALEFEDERPTQPSRGPRLEIIAGE